MARKFIDETGNRYGMLTVLSYNEKEQKWLCKCDCGNQKLILRRNFANGPTRSCGCMKGKSDKKVKNLIGQKFGRLTVIKRVLPNRKSLVVWLCKCDCGVEKELLAKELTSGNTKSCGCLKKQVDTEKIESYIPPRTEGVVTHLFTDKARKDSSTGYRGVSKYLTRSSKELRYQAWITVAGKRYYKSGFLTARDAYYIGRKWLEEKHLPKKQED